MPTCPRCKKNYPSKTQGCPSCKPRRKKTAPRTRDTKLISPRKRTTGKRPSPRKAPRAQAPDPYVDFFEGNSRETRELGDLLKKDSIPYRIEERDTLKFRFRLHETRQLGMGDGRAIKIPTSLLGKAKALLKWEQGIQRQVSGEDDPSTTLQGSAACPSCAADVGFEDTLCPECGLDLHLAALESDEEEYYCLSCGEACGPEAPVCPFCGAKFDH